MFEIFKTHILGINYDSGLPASVSVRYQIIFNDDSGRSPLAEKSLNSITFTSASRLNRLNKDLEFILVRFCF